jgi:hypothetical protein
MKKLLLLNLVFGCIFLLSCSKQESKWKETTASNTINAYHKFDSLFPNSSHHKEVIENIDLIRKTYGVKCLVVIRNGIQDPRNGNITYIGTVQHQQSGWFDIKSPMRPAIYLWRDLPEFGDVIFKDTRDKYKIERNVIYFEGMGNVNLYVPQEIVSDLTDEQIAKQYYIDYIDSLKSEQNSGTSYTVHTDGEKWIQKGIYNNNK